MFVSCGWEMMSLVAQSWDGRVLLVDTTVDMSPGLGWVVVSLSLRRPAPLTRRRQSPFKGSPMTTGRPTCRRRVGLCLHPDRVSSLYRLPTSSLTHTPTSLNTRVRPFRLRFSRKLISNLSFLFVHWYPVGDFEVFRVRSSGVKCVTYCLICRTVRHVRFWSLPHKFFVCY